MSEHQSQQAVAYCGATKQPANGKLPDLHAPCQAGLVIPGHMQVSKLQESCRLLHEVKPTT